MGLPDLAGDALADLDRSDRGRSTCSPVQPNGLAPPAGLALLTVADDANLLPPMHVPSTLLPAMSRSSAARHRPLHRRPAASISVFWPRTGGTPSTRSGRMSWEDDLIMTGVRSFDIKAYDNGLADYADLGWGDDPRLTAHQPSGRSGGPAFLDLRRTPIVIWPPATRQSTSTTTDQPDLRPRGADAAAGRTTSASTPSIGARRDGLSYAAYPQRYTGNIGDDNTGSRPPAAGLGFLVDRLQPGPGHGRVHRPGHRPLTRLPRRPAVSRRRSIRRIRRRTRRRLRGIQIQIRVADPTNQRIKTLTIRQDFTDKL